MTVDSRPGINLRPLHPAFRPAPVVQLEVPAPDVFDLDRGRRQVSQWSRRLSGLPLNGQQVFEQRGNLELPEREGPGRVDYPLIKFPRLTTKASTCSRTQAWPA